jgi:hypothetical protein
VRTARPSVGIGAVTALVAVAVAGCGGSGKDSTESTTGRPPAQRPTQASIQRLRSLAESVGHPVYWAGPRPGGYELTVDVNGNIFIRYLEGRVPTGSRRQTSLTVATYPYASAYRTLQSAAKQQGETASRTPDGGLVVASKEGPDNVHVAYPGQDIQIEVYDPHAGRALALARAGAITQLR